MEELKMVDRMQELIANRIQHDIFAPRALLTLQGQEIKDLQKILHGYRRLLEATIIHLEDWEGVQPK